MAPNMISSNVVEHDNVLLSSSSSVEKAILNKSIYTKDMYAPTEKTRTFVVDSFPLLGKVVAYRFIEWVIIVLQYYSVGIIIIVDIVIIRLLQIQKVSVHYQLVRHLNIL